MLTDTHSAQGVYATQTPFQVSQREPMNIDQSIASICQSKVFAHASMVKGIIPWLEELVAWIVEIDKDTELVDAWVNRTERK